MPIANLKLTYPCCNTGLAATPIICNFSSIDGAISYFC